MSLQQVFALVLATTVGERTHEFEVGSLVLDSGVDVLREGLVGGLSILSELLLIVYRFRGESLELESGIHHPRHGLLRWTGERIACEEGKVGGEVS